MLALLLILSEWRSGWLIYCRHHMCMLVLQLGDFTRLHIVLRNKLLHGIVIRSLCCADVCNVAFEPCVLYCFVCCIFAVREIPGRCQG